MISKASAKVVYEVTHRFVNLESLLDSDTFSLTLWELLNGRHSAGDVWTIFIYCKQSSITTIVDQLATWIGTLLMFSCSCQRFSKINLSFCPPLVSLTSLKSISRIIWFENGTFQSNFVFYIFDINSIHFWCHRYQNCEERRVFKVYL